MLGHNLEKTAVVAVIEFRLSAYKINGCLEIIVLAGIAFKELSCAKKKTPEALPSLDER